MSYGAVAALRGVSLCVPVGRIITLIGANGAGKTTLLRTISGLLKAKSGSILYYPPAGGNADRPRGSNNSQTTIAPPSSAASAAPAPMDILRCRSHQVVAAGIVHVPEGRGIFANLTVAENLSLGGFLRRDAHLEQDREHVLELFPRLKERYRQSAGTLSGGEQQMLAIARGLMTRPRLLLLDEPSLGLAPRLVQQIFATIVRINAEGTSILLVEQNAHMALNIAHYAYCLETGTIACEGPARELAERDEIKRAYLGG